MKLNGLTALMIVQVRENLTKAMKARNTVEMGILRMILSAIQSLEATQGKALTEDQGISVVKKLINQNNEEIEFRSGNEQYAAGIERLNAEIVILTTYLPIFLSADKIKEVLCTDDNWPQIKSAKNAGAAMGVAIRLLKDVGAVEGQTVKNVVAEVYASGERM